MQLNVVTALLVLLNTVAASPPSKAPAREFPWNVGVGRIKITPEGPYWMAGYASRNRPSDGTVQDLYAKAIAIDDAQGSRFVIVTMDILVITRELTESVSRRAEKEYGLPRSRLLLNCSHTHCGPEVRLYRKKVHNIPDEFADKMVRYVKSLEDHLVEVIGIAVKNRRAAQLSFSQDNAAFAINRRNNREQDVPKLKKEGRLRGPIDHAVPVMVATDARGKMLAVLFGYACHNTVLSFYKTCGDYAGFAQQYVEQRFPGAQAMFVMGAGGDQNPSPRRLLEHAEQHGKALGEAVERALAADQRTVNGPLRVALANAVLTFQDHPDRMELEKQARSGNQYQRWKANYILGELDAGRHLPTQYELPTQVAAFGNDLLLVAIGGETVVEYALRVKQKYRRDNGPAIWVAGYSNDVFGYLPSLRVLKEGGYEGGGHMVYTKFPGPFRQTVEEDVFDVIERLVEQVASASR